MQRIKLPQERDKLLLSKRSMEKINKNTVSSNSVTFGTKKEADESAHRINKLHEVIKGEMK